MGRYNEYGLTKEEAERAAQRIIAEASQGSYIGLDELKRRLADRRKAKRAGGTDLLRQARRRR